MKKKIGSVTAGQAARVVDSPVGPLYLAATDSGLTHVLFVARMKSGHNSQILYLLHSLLLIAVQIRFWNWQISSV